MSKRFNLAAGDLPRSLFSLWACRGLEMALRFLGY